MFMVQPGACMRSNENAICSVSELMPSLVMSDLLSF